jgi:anti-anti-sigma factor
MTPMTLAESRRDDGCYLIEIAGEVDLAQTDRLSAALARGADHQAVLLDLSQCEFMDSSAIGLIILSNLQLERDGRRLALLTPGAEVMRVLTLTGLADTDLVFADEQAARAALGLG